LSCEIGGIPSSGIARAPSEQWRRII